MRFSLTQVFDRFARRFAPEERIAGLVVEETRVRAAEFRIVSDAHSTLPHFALRYEGAAALPPGTLHGGELVRVEALSEAVSALRRSGSDKALTASRVIASLPLLQSVSTMVHVPPSVHGKEQDEVLRLEAERLLPFPLSEAYVDWQEIKGGDADNQGKPFLLVGARKADVDPYMKAIEAAGLVVVAVEPVFMSIARGLRDRTGVIYALWIYETAVLAAGIDASGNLRAFHQRSILAPSIEERDLILRAKVIASELASFVRFYRSEYGGVEHEIILDGSADTATLEEIRSVSGSVSLPLRYEPDGHLLSKAAVRGAALRGSLGRSEDMFVSLTAVGTEQAYEQQRASFFVHAGFRALAAVFGIAILLFGMSGAYLFMKERELRNTIQVATLSSQERTYLDTAVQFHTAVAGITQLIPASTVEFEVVSELWKAVPQGIIIERFTISMKGEAFQAEVAGRAATFGTYDMFVALLNTRFSSTPLTIVPELLITKPNNTPFSHSFSLRPIR